MDLFGVFSVNLFTCWTVSGLRCVSRILNVRNKFQLYSIHEYFPVFYFWNSQQGTDPPLVQYTFYLMLSWSYPETSELGTSMSAPTNFVGGKSMSLTCTQDIFISGDRGTWTRWTDVVWQFLKLGMCLNMANSRKQGCIMAFWGVSGQTTANRGKQYHS